jgi:sugar O-acyltransferase (sialic acid O-acetyltransferase NeuD family)
MKTLAILGLGHLGQQIAHFAISDHHYQKVIFFDDFSKANEVNGFQILGNSDDIEFEFERNSFDELLIGIGYKHLETRMHFYERFVGEIPFGKIVHSSCWLDTTAIIHEGCVLYPMSTIDANVEINANTIINVSCTIAHDSVIGKHCFLSPRVAIAGFVKISNLCIIGINATIIDTISIVARTQIGAGTVIIMNLDINGLYVGNPQRFIR